MEEGGTGERETYQSADWGGSSVDGLGVSISIFEDALSNRING